MIVASLSKVLLPALIEAASVLHPIMYIMFVCTHIHKWVCIFVLHLYTGQFWNIPINVVHYSQPIDGLVRSDTYTITVNHPGQQRQFVGFLYPLTWEFEENQCLFVGNGQGAPIDEVENPNDPVIYGEYTDYKVDSIFGTEFDYGHFQSSRCSQLPIPYVNPVD